MQDFINKLILKMPNWLRWLLILPMAQLADLAAQSIFQIILHAFPWRAVRPYSDEFIWRVLASAFFLAGGLKMAPKYWFQVAVALVALKTIVAVTNIYILGKYLFDGGTWTAPAFVTNAPVWWSLSCH